MNEKILQKMSLRADIYLRSLPEEHWLRVLHTRFENGSFTEPLEDIQPLIDCIARKPANTDVLKYGVKLGYAVRKKKPLLNPNNKIVNLIEPVVAMSLLNKIPLTSKQVNQICDLFEHNNTLLHNSWKSQKKRTILLYLIPLLPLISLNMAAQSWHYFTSYIMKDILWALFLIILLLYVQIILFYPAIFFTKNIWILFSIKIKQSASSFYQNHPSRSAIPSLAQRLKVSPRAITYNYDDARDTLNTLYHCTQTENNDNSNIYDTRSTMHISLLLQQFNQMIHEDSSIYALLNKIDRLLSVPVLPYMRNKADEEPESYFNCLHNLRLPLMLGLIRSLEESGDASCLKTLQRLVARGYCPDVRQAALNACPIVEERGRLNQQPSTLLRPALGHDSNSLLLPATSKPLSDLGLLRQSEYPIGVTSSPEATETVVIKKSE